MMTNTTAASGAAFKQTATTYAQLVELLRDVWQNGRGLGSCLANDIEDALSNAQEGNHATATAVLSLVLDDIDTCIGEAGAGYEFQELSTETLEAIAAYRATAAQETVHAVPYGWDCAGTLERMRPYSKDGVQPVALYAHPPRPQADAGAVLAVPEGRRLVPASSDEWMESAGDEQIRLGKNSGDVYDAMLATAPQAPAAPTAPAADQAPAPAVVTPGAEEMLEALQLVASKLESRPYGTGSYIPKPIREKVHAAIANHLRADAQAPAAQDMESVLIDGVAYSVPAAVAGELLRLHLEAMQAPAAGAAPTDAFWWRKRADEIELAVALSGSTKAMRYYTDMRTLLQAVSLRAAAPAQGTEDGWMPIETAPEDQAVICAAEFGGRAGDWRIKVGYLDSRTDAWVVWGASWEPSKWRHLPPPPAARARQEGQA